MVSSAADLIDSSVAGGLAQRWLPQTTPFRLSADRSSHNRPTSRSLVAAGPPRAVDEEDQIPHWPDSPDVFGPDRTLSLLNANTGDRAKVVFYSGGRYRQRALREINFLMRDHRSHEIMHIDVKLIEFLHQIVRQFDEAAEITILSGYRSPETNAALARQQYAVARNSYHLQGRAADIRIDGLSTEAVAQVAWERQHGGIGRYPASGFVHVDTGPVRHWVHDTGSSVGGSTKFES